MEDTVNSLSLLALCVCLRSHDSLHVTRPACEMSCDSHTLNLTLTVHLSPSVLAGHEGTGGIGETVGHHCLVDESREGLVSKPVGERFVECLQLFLLLLLPLSLVSEGEAFFSNILELLALEFREVLQTIFVNWVYQVEDLIADRQSVV